MWVDLFFQNVGVFSQNVDGFAMNHYHPGNTGIHGLGGTNGESIAQTVDTGAATLTLNDGMRPMWLTVALDLARARPGST